MNSITLNEDWYKSEQKRLQNSRTKMVQAHYEFINQQFFIVELNQIVDLLKRYKGFRNVSTRLFPIYVPVSLKLLMDLETKTDEVLKLPRVKISYESRLFVLSKETVSDPLNTIDDCIKVMDGFKVTNLVEHIGNFGEIEIYQKMFKIAARVFLT